MKLYVRDIRNHNRQISLNIEATDRPHLAYILGSPEFFVEGEVYHVNQVYAVSDSNDLTTGAVIGGAIGLLGGPIGVAIGGLIGGAIGNTNDNAEADKVRRFNGSSFYGNIDDIRRMR